MFEDNDTPNQKPIDLERLSVEDLHERIEALKADILACEAELERKKSHKSAADAFFGGDD